MMQFDRQLLDLGHDERLPADLRIAALDGLAGRLGPLDDKAFALLIYNLSDKVEPLERVAAARALGAERAAAVA